ncbi:MAG: thymidine phosphorylase [Clostridia bacterium]|nr:thymidine phosphorylase [Clostridia bacterium]
MLKMYDIITKKQQGRELNEDEIAYFVKGVTDQSIPDYQISAFLMAVWFRGMTEEETLILTECMTDSGETNELLSIKGKKVDKHSTGGVGDKVSLIVGPMVAAANKGVYMPKMAGRGLGFTGGTLDKLESCTGVSTEISAEEFESITRELGFCIAGQSKRLSPADGRMSALRDVTGTANCIPLIAASVMSKKLASGSECIVLDVKCGSGSFCKTMREAEELARLMVRIGAKEKRKTVALITDMSSPLGCAVGNSVELIEAIRVLEGRGNERLTELCITVAANILYAANVADYESCVAIAEETLYDGSALDKLASLVERLGGDKRYIYDTSLFEESNVTAMLVAEKSGYVTRIDAYEVGRAASVLGAGRDRIGEAIDPTAGIILNKHVGDRIEEGEALATLQAKTIERAQSGMEYLFRAVTIGDLPPEENKIVLKVI